MISDGYLTRKRVKTEKQQKVPLVKYKLWEETIELLEKENRQTLWLTARNGPLATDRIEQGKVKRKDLCGLN